ncbi:hypothetical protein L249_3437, partial [Ophiocordyceps polyrhachis-furcata BCC 54312]
MARRGGRGAGSRERGCFFIDDDAENGRDRFDGGEFRLISGRDKTAILIYLPTNAWSEDLVLVVVMSVCITATLPSTSSYGHTRVCKATTLGSTTRGARLPRLYLCLLSESDFVAAYSQVVALFLSRGWVPSSKGATCFNLLGAVLRAPRVAGIEVPIPSGLRHNGSQQQQLSQYDCYVYPPGGVVPGGTQVRRYVPGTLCSTDRQGRTWYEKPTCLVTVRTPTGQALFCYVQRVLLTSAKKSAVLGKLGNASSPLLSFFFPFSFL